MYNLIGVCLIESESGAETSKVQEYPNLSTSYGIFQVNKNILATCELCHKHIDLIIKLILD